MRVSVWIVVGSLAAGPAWAGNGIGPGETGDDMAGPVAAAPAPVISSASAGGEGCAPWEARNLNIPPRPRISASALLVRSRL